MLDRILESRFMDRFASPRSYLTVATFNGLSASVVFGMAVGGGPYANLLWSMFIINITAFSFSLCGALGFAAGERRYRHAVAAAEQRNAETAAQLAEREARARALDTRLKELTSVTEGKHVR